MVGRNRDRLRWCLRVLLRAFPQDFRRSYGADLERTYLDWHSALEARGARRPMARVLASATWHSVREGLTERLTGGGRGGEGRMESLVTDLRMALRSLGKAPGFTLAAVLVLALGVGANATSFSALRVAALADPPFPEVERMVSVDLTRGSTGRVSRTQWAYPYFDVLERWQGRLVDPVAAYRDMHATVSGLGPAAEVPIEIVSPGYFQVVGLSPVIGRDFAPDEGVPEVGARVAIISHSFWLGRLDGSAAALGREIRLNGEGFQVIGVAPQGFRGLMGDTELWVAHGSYDTFQPGVLDQAYNHLAWVVGRLKPGATLEAAQEQAVVMGETIGSRWPVSRRYGVALRSLDEVWTNPGARAASLLLSVAAGLVLLVACANLSGLMLARARRNIGSVAVRLALGASRWRLIRASIIESLTFATLGLVAAIAVSSWGTRMLTLAWPRAFLRGRETGLRVVDPASLGIDHTVVLFAAGASALAAVFIGVLPAVRASSGVVTEHLKAGRAPSGGPGWSRRWDAHTVLVSGQISMALVLLIVVAALGSSVSKVMSVKEGFRTERLLTFDYTLPAGVPRFDYQDLDVWRSHITQSADFDDRMKQRLTALPGVESVAISANAMLEGFNAVIGVTSVDGVRPTMDDSSVGAVSVDPEAFETLGFAVVSGRGFTEADGLANRPVVVVNQQAVDAFFQREDPVGRLLGVGTSLPDREVAEVVGVVENVLHERPDEVPAPVVYYSTRERRYGRHALVRTSGDPNQMVEAIRKALQDLDPTVAMSNVATMDERIRRSVGDRAMLLALLGVFGGVTVLLVAVGTWAVVSNAVADRVRELAIRVALGADKGSVLRLVMGRTAAASILGGLVGLAGGLGCTHVIRAFLFETSPRDPGLVAAGVGLMALVILLASYLPARRATRVDPALELKRQE